MNKSAILTIIIACLAFASCSSDDEPKIPTNAISLNLTRDGGTTIGGSDVYMNNSDNFTTQYCAIADLGQKSGFNRNPVLTQLAQEVAVTPGNYYQIMAADDIRDVAGERAYPLDANFYNLHVDSWLYDKNNDLAGAKVTYAECFPEDSRLPKWDENLEIHLDPSHDGVGTYTFGKDCHIDSDISVSSVNNSSLHELLQFEVDDNKLTVSNKWALSGVVKAVVLVRHESVYTRVNFTITSRF